MNILLTGGAGFIGSHIARAYLKAGHRVVVIDNLSTGCRDNVPAGATFHPLDIQDPQIRDILRKENIQVVNHHAAQISVHASVEDPAMDAKINILGTLQLIQNALSYGVQKFVFASTGGAIYGDPDYFPACENHPCRPSSPYGIAKLCVEHYLEFFKSHHRLNTAILRYANVYGPGQNAQGEAGVVAIFCERLLRNQPLVVFGDGEQTRDFVCVKDVVQANLLALDDGCSGTFNIGTGEETSVTRLARLLLKITRRQAEISHVPERHYEQRRSAISYRKFGERFGWKPAVSLEDGLRETFEFYNGQTVGIGN
jgi:UDP-glucose 4-epimerase